MVVHQGIGWVQGHPTGHVYRVQSVCIGALDSHAAENIGCAEIRQGKLLLKDFAEIGQKIIRLHLLKIFPTF